MLHIDLFSGIGGFALAVDTIWPDTEHIFCDNDKFCQAVLKKHWPNSIIYGDIRTLRLNPDSDSDRQLGREKEINPAEAQFKTLGNAEKCDGTLTNPQRISLQREGGNEKRQLGQTDGKSEKDGQTTICDTTPHISSGNTFILTGGFPCQPFSQAGRRKGTADDRYLWPEMLRVIREFSPLWVIAENVGGLVTWNEGMVLEQVCTDLEGEGYEVQPFIIPAVSVNAPHRRDRVWFVAHRKSSGLGTRVYSSEGSATDREHLQEDRQQGERQGIRIGENGGDATDTADRRCEEHGTQSGTAADFSQQGFFNVANSIGEGLSRMGQEKSGTGERKVAKNKQEKCEVGCDNARCDTGWDKNWVEVATEFCGVDDGLPVELDGLKLSKAGHRTQRLKSLGNAIVPQVAMEIMKQIKLTL